MELKKYQKNVIADLRDYLAEWEDVLDPAEAYRSFWESRQIAVGDDGVPEYQDTLDGVPRVCFKVPTGGGKTLLAAASLRPIFEILPPSSPRVVVWLVPTEAILTQTLAALRSPEHPYRQQLNLSFGSRVEVYSKEALLAGENFSPAAVTEQVSVMVLTFDSFRREKEKLQSFKANEHLTAFASFLGTPDQPITLAEPGSLFQIINQLRPVVIVDESHHTTSKLSRDMLTNFNPRLVLELTATPAEGANVIAYVDAYQLKTEHMVKLPVIAYNRRNREEVITDAIDLRASLEKSAIEEREKSGRYVRPIVLFQAEPKAREDAASFEKLKTKLIEIGIPDDQIAIKTANVDELKGVDLLSEECPIRYVITVNALGEGWDCPFAYILATLANKTSPVSVEQILGRVLRQPHAKRMGSNLLNMSYVLTASAHFSAALESIIEGLNAVGFTAKDYRVAEDLFTVDTEDGTDSDTGSGKDDSAEVPEDGDSGGAKGKEEPGQSTKTGGGTETGTGTGSDEDFLDFDPDAVADDLTDRKDKGSSGSSGPAKTMTEEAEKQGRSYDEEAKENKDSPPSGGPSGGPQNSIKVYSMIEDLEKDARALEIPQFHIETPPSILNPEGGFDLLSPDNLSGGFSLVGKSYAIDLKGASEEMYSIDVRKKGLTPKAVAMRQADQKALRDSFVNLPKESRIRQCSGIVYERVNRLDAVGSADLRSFVDLLVGSLDDTQLTVLEDSPMLVAREVEALVKSHLEMHRREEFQRLVELGRIRTSPSYRLPKVINLSKANNLVGGSLYEAEDSMNGEEEELALKFGSLNSVEWWHRIIERRGFCLNGFINHYPDFLLKMSSGRIVVVEYKGAQLRSDDSAEKLALGQKWANLAGPKYRYYMVFADSVEPIEGALNVSQLYTYLEDL